MADRDAADLQTATAHRTWDARWRSEAGRADWLDPEPFVMAAAAEVATEAHDRRALDLGCGVGRHALWLAEQGWRVDAFDGSEAGLAHVAKEAAARGLPVACQRGLMTALPYADGVFDLVLSWNVIYHGDESVVRRAIAEIARVLRPRGHSLGSMLPKTHAGFGRGREVAPNTWVQDDGAGDPGGDKVHPHFFCDEAQLRGLFASFDLLRLERREHKRPGSWHWHLLARRA
jgi:tellurite methyltransferase